uniref:Uncharacterized protein n=1 Tax=Pseudo-nitzschia australis TaxID=44445 RepID=A0A7S4EH16_9STRA|mmetsp:Transcript_12833/g.26249  ORF Transcript_12833/g.26249 Transcript_12833/m.26249 type:complete len:574 (+) Transcript_12833:440-2161(+)
MNITMQSSVIPIPKTCVVADSSANAIDTMNWESQNLVIRVHKSLNSGIPPITIDLAKTLGSASDLPLAIKKACRYWFDPSIKTKVDVVRYINAICRQSGFKISTLSNSKQGLDRRAQLVCSRGIIARKPRGKSLSVQTTTTRPITSEEKCPFSITVYECRQSGRWYIRKYGNGSKMHCGHCKLLPEQVGIRQFQSLTERNGETWSDEQIKYASENERKNDLQKKTADQSPNETAHINKKIEVTLLAQAEQEGMGLNSSADNTLKQDVEKDQVLKGKNGIDDRAPYLNNTNTYRDQLLLQQTELSRLQYVGGRQDGIDWSSNNMLQQQQCLPTYDGLRGINNPDDRLLLERQLGPFALSIPKETIRVGFLGDSIARQNEYLSARSYLNNAVSINSDRSFLLEQLEIRRRLAITERNRASWYGHNGVRERLSNIVAAERGGTGKRNSTDLDICNDDRRSLNQEKHHILNASSNGASVIENSSDANNFNNRYRSAIPPETADATSLTNIANEQNHVSPHNHPGVDQIAEDNAVLSVRKKQWITIAQIIASRTVSLMIQARTWQRFIKTTMPCSDPW